MDLDKRTYIDGSTIITAQNLNDIQDAIIDLEQNRSVPTSVREAIYTLFANAAYITTGLDDELAVVEAWAEQVYSLTLNKTSLELNQDTPQSITATVVPSDATVSWSSSDTDVATVSDGVVTGVANGTCVITATAGDLTATCNVTVSGFATLESISAVYTQSGTVYDTDSLDSLKADLVVTATYSDTSTETIPSTDYTLSGTLESGTSTITATYGTKTTTFNVTVTGTIKLTNGTHNFSDGSYVTVENNHIEVYLATQVNSQARFINPSNLDGNTNSIFSNSNVNNQSSTFISLNSGETLTFDVFNASSDNTSFPAQAQDFAIVMNIRKQNTTTNVLSSGITLYPSVGTTPGHDRVTEGTSSATMTQNTVASNIVIYIPAGYPAQTTFECDVRIVKS